MSQHRLSPEAEADLREIWSYVAAESGSAMISDRLIDALLDSILLLATNPHLGRRRDSDLRPGLRSFSVSSYVIIYRVEGDDSLMVLRILHGRRDLPALIKI